MIEPNTEDRASQTYKKEYYLKIQERIAYSWFNFS